MEFLTAVQESERAGGRSNGGWGGRTGWKKRSAPRDLLHYVLSGRSEVARYLGSLYTIHSVMNFRNPEFLRLFQPSRLPSLGNVVWNRGKTGPVTLTPDRSDREIGSAVFN